MSNPLLNIEFLGTGTSGGVPMIGCHCEVCSSGNPKDHRLRSSILVKSETTNLVVDTGPDFRQQMLRAHNEKLNAILYTHPHMDHVAGLDDVRAYNYFQHKPMRLYANVMTQNALKRIFYYAFEEHKYPGVPQLELKTIDRDPFMVGDIPVQPIHVWHHLMDVIGFRMGDFTYITDVNKIDDDQLALIQGSKVLVLGALGKVQHISHFSLEEAIAVVEKLDIPEAYFTHIGHRMGLYDITEKELPSHIHLAYDGLKLQV